MAPLLLAAAVGLPALLAALLILRWRAAESPPAHLSAPPADVAPPAPLRLPTPAPRRAPTPSAPLHDRDLPPAAEWRAWLWTYAWDGATSPMLPALPTTPEAPAAALPAPSAPALAEPEPPAVASATPPPSIDE